MALVKLHYRPNSYVGPYTFDSNGNSNQIFDTERPADAYKIRQLCAGLGMTQAGAEDLPPPQDQPTDAIIPDAVPGDVSPPDHQSDLSRARAKAAHGYRFGPNDAIADFDALQEAACPQSADPITPRKRGRPRKDASASASVTTPRRGRPKKSR